MSHTPAHSLALVVLVNNLADWRRITDEGWYRIPLRHAPQPVAVSFLAFYLSRVFGPDAFQVRFYAPVLRYQTLTRRELIPEQPAHPRAAERYYRIEVGPLNELERPVPSRRLRRITFIPTTLGRLLEADEINDLWIGDDVEDILWSLFRDAGIKAERRLEIGEGRGRYTLPMAIPRNPEATRGIAIFCGGTGALPTIPGWDTLRFAAETIRNQPMVCVEAVRQALGRGK
jgi:hypothetical protein